MYCHLTKQAQINRRVVDAFGDFIWSAINLNN
jgi:hypothetical protein